VKTSTGRQEWSMNTPKKKILIVDDDLEMLKLLRRALSARYELVVAPTSYDMEIMVNHFAPDLIILDLRLGDHNGADVCRGIRKQAAYDGIGILILSGLDEPKVAAAAIWGGADSYMTKPFDIHTLQSTIHHVIEMKALGPAQNAPVGAGRSS
jgi:DNA-binding response OmpR family regulator